MIARNLPEPNNSSAESGEPAAKAAGEGSAGEEAFGGEETSAGKGEAAAEQKAAAEEPPDEESSGEEKSDDKPGSSDGPEPSEDDRWVNTGAPSVTGALDKAVIEGVMEEHRDELMDCRITSGRMRVKCIRKGCRAK